jgi:RNA polymerase sigma-32 factor
VATTKAQRKLFFNLRKQKKRLGWLNQTEVNRVARDLGVKPEVVTEMESRLAGQDIGFDLTNDDDESSYVAPAAYLQGLTVSPADAIEAEDWEQHHHDLLFEGVESLDDRSRDIIQSRWLLDPKSTLQDLADKYGVSAERIRQLEAVALKKLKARFDA